MNKRTIARRGHQQGELIRFDRKNEGRSGTWVSVPVAFTGGDAHVGTSAGSCESAGPLTVARHSLSYAEGARSSMRMSWML